MVSCLGAELSCGGGGEAARTPVACEKLLRLAVPRETLLLRVRLLAELAPGSRRDPQRRCADSGDPRHRLQLQGRRAGEHEKRQKDARKSHGNLVRKALGRRCVGGRFLRRCVLSSSASIRGFNPPIAPSRVVGLRESSAGSAPAHRAKTAATFAFLPRCCRVDGSRLSCSCLLHLAHTCCLHSVRPNARCCPRQHSGTVQWLLALTLSRLPTRWRT